MPDTVPPPQPPPPVDAPPAVTRNTGMLVLAYLGLLALVPLIVEKNDREVQWHAKHGLVLFGAFVVIYIALGIMSTFLGFFVLLYPLVWLAWVAVTILGIVKALKGQRLIIPGVSDFANKF